MDSQERQELLAKAEDPAYDPDEDIKARHKALQKEAQALKLLEAKNRAARRSETKGKKKHKRSQKALARRRKQWTDENIRNEQALRTAIAKRQRSMSKEEGDMAGLLMVVAEHYAEEVPDYYGISPDESPGFAHYLYGQLGEVLRDNTLGAAYLEQRKLWLSELQK